MSRRPLAVLNALAAVAPGTPLRDGLDRIVKAKMGALVVVGDGPEVLNICSGGFLLDAAFTPQRLSELAKMDGAIILAGDASRIARANVHLVPPTQVPTSETGMRHRTAERVARAIPVAVISVSEDMGVITVYVGDTKKVLEEIPRLLGRANQAINTLERYKTRLDDVSALLATLELEDLVTIRDVASVLQRSEMVRRISDEIEASIIELGADGRLIRLQLDELTGDVADDATLVLEDYMTDPDELAMALAELGEFTDDQLLDLKTVSQVLGGSQDPDNGLQSRGRRLLARVPRLNDEAARKVVERFVTLQGLLRASVDELAEIDGIDGAQARSIKDGLSRMTETSILDRYV
jgi:diadenylate cyclase